MWKRHFYHINHVFSSAAAFSPFRLHMYVVILSVAPFFHLTNVKSRGYCEQNTVEDRLQQVQDRKQRMISGALTDDEVRSARIQDLKILFS